MSRATVRRYRAIKRKIKAFRVGKKWSFTDMGKVLGMTRGAASLLEKSNSRVSLDTLFALSDRAKRPVAAFLP